MAAAPTSRRYTIDDLDQFPDDGRLRELVNGEVVEWDVTDFRHGLVIGLLAQEIGTFARPRRLGSIVLADAYVKILGSREDVRGGDIEFYVRARVPKEQHAPATDIAPDFVVEVLSPTDRASVVQAKVRDWMRTGVKLLWYVDPDSGVTTVYRSMTGTMVGPEEELSAEDILPGFVLRMRDVLDELADELSGHENGPKSEQ